MEKERKEVQRAEREMETRGTNLLRHPTCVCPVVMIAIHNPFILCARKQFRFLAITVLDLFSTVKCCYMLLATVCVCVYL